MGIVPGEMLIKCRAQCFLVAWMRLATVKKGLKNKFQSLLIHSSHGPLRTQRAVGNNHRLRPKGPEVYYQICHLLAVGFFSELFNFSKPQFTCISNMDVKTKWSYKVPFSLKIPKPLFFASAKCYLSTISSFTCNQYTCTFKCSPHWTTVKPFVPLCEVTVIISQHTSLIMSFPRLKHVIILMATTFWECSLCSRHCSRCFMWFELFNFINNRKRGFYYYHPILQIRKPRQSLHSPKHSTLQPLLIGLWKMYCPHYLDINLNS